MTHHESYELLCVLAATGQLIGAEQADFEAHCVECSTCREQVRSLESISVQVQFHAAFESTPASMPAGYVERFRARVVREGMMVRSKGATRLAFCVKAAAVIPFIIAALLVSMPHGQKVAEFPRIASASAIASQGKAVGAANGGPMEVRPAKFLRVGLRRNSHTLRSDAKLREGAHSEQQFPQMIAASYPYFAPQADIKSKVPNYPALSASQISRLDVFRALADSTSEGVRGAASDAHPIDIASAGKAFDFAAQIRQLHFQLPAAQ